MHKSGNKTALTASCQGVRASKDGVLLTLTLWRIFHHFGQPFQRLAALYILLGNSLLSLGAELQRVALRTVGWLSGPSRVRLWYLHTRRWQVTLGESLPLENVDFDVQAVCLLLLRPLSGRFARLRRSRQGWRPDLCSRGIGALKGYPPFPGPDLTFLSRQCSRPADTGPRTELGPSAAGAFQCCAPAQGGARGQDVALSGL